MKNRSRILACLLALIFILSAFSGCKKQEETKTTEYVYVPTYQPLSCPDVEYIGNVAMTKDKIFILGEGVTGKDTYTDPETGDSWENDVYGYSFYSANLDGSDLKKVDYEVNSSSSEGNTETYSWVNRLQATRSGDLLIFRESSVTTFDLPDDFDPETDQKWNYDSTYESSIWVDVLGSDGTLKKSAFICDTSGNEEDYFYVDRVAEDNDGILYICSYNQFRAYDKDFNLLYTIKDEKQGFNSITSCYNGDILTTRWNEDYTVLHYEILDKTAHTFTEGAVVDNMNIGETYLGNENYDYFFNTSTGLFGAHVATGKSEPILNWLDSDIDSSTVRGVQILDEETVLCLTMTYGDEGNQSELVTLKKTDASTLPEEKVLTMACLYTNYTVKRDVLAFNKSNNGTRIRVVDYSEYNTGEDWNAGLTKLNVEITSGNVPDIFLLNGELPVERYAAKGILTDLTPFVEKEFGKDSLVEPFVNTLRSEDGKLYELYSHFTLETAIALKKAVGDRTSWNVSELLEAYKNLPEGATIMDKYTAKDSVLYSCILRNLSHFVNWETGECRFDTPEFIDLLKFTDYFPLEIDWDNPEIYENDVVVSPSAIAEETEDTDPLTTGQQLMRNLYCYDLCGFRGETFYRYGDDLAFIGLPTYEGNGASFNSSGIGFAISESCKEKDAAWNFLKKYMTAEYQTEDSYSLPTNKKAFDTLVERERTPLFPQEGEEPWIPEDLFYTYSEGATNADGKKEIPKTYTWINNHNVPVYAMTDAEYNAFMDILNNTTSFSRYDANITTIIQEETEAFFQGQKTAEDTARMIQSRAKLYVNESK